MHQPFRVQGADPVRTPYRTVDPEALVGFRGVGLGHTTKAATSAPSRALPRRRAVVHELEEAEVERQLVLRETPVRAQPGAQQGAVMGLPTRRQASDVTYFVLPPLA